MFDFFGTGLFGLSNFPILFAFLLGMLPISEVRGGAIYAFAVGQPWLILPAIIGNVLVAPLLLFFWELFGIEEIGKKILGSAVEKKRNEMNAKYEKYGMPGIAIFIGIPLPATGVYSGVLIAKILKIRKRDILLASVLGVLMSAAICFALLSIGFAL